MRVSYFKYNLKFRHPFTISKGTKTHQPTFIVELEDSGFKGYGEAPAISYYDIPVEKMIEDLEGGRSFVEHLSLTTPEEVWNQLHIAFPNNYFLICALDMATWDIYGQMQGKKLREFWSNDTDLVPLTDYTIGIDNLEKMAAKVIGMPWPVYKLKVGTADDVTIVKTLRDRTGAGFRVDANAAWNLDEALQIIPELAALGVELVEQPLSKDNWQGMQTLYRQSSLPLFADESCVLETDVEKCRDHYHGINIKLTKCGGITPALRMIKAARDLNLKIMAGCMNESTIGSAAIAHLLPLVDFADMDGPLLLEQDVATGLKYDFGKVILSDAPGLGIEHTGLYEK